MNAVWLLATVPIILLYAVGVAIMGWVENKNWITVGKSEFYVYQSNQKTSGRRMFVRDKYPSVMTYGYHRSWLNHQTDVLDINKMD